MTPEERVAMGRRGQDYVRCNTSVEVLAVRFERALVAQDGGQSEAQQRRDTKRARYLLRKRIVDIVLATILLTLSWLPILIVCLVIKLTSRGPAIYVSDRVGIENTRFKMYKFRTMRVDAPAVATHLLKEYQLLLTPVGRILRLTSLDELPQLINILKGEMSFVGPRPALFNQSDLITLRTARGVHRMLPGLTGWAQVNGRDEIPIPTKVELDAYYVEHASLLLDVKILWTTIGKVLRREDIKY
jgi:O-antigen biosynthesis protein WbqP